MTRTTALWWGVERVIITSLSAFADEWWRVAAERSILNSSGNYENLPSNTWSEALSTFGLVEIHRIGAASIGLNLDRTLVLDGEIDNVCQKSAI
jgi:hypothetical protein